MILLFVGMAGKVEAWPSSSDDCNQSVADDVFLIMSLGFFSRVRVQLFGAVRTVRVARGLVTARRSWFSRI